MNPLARNKLVPKSTKSSSKALFPLSIGIEKQKLTKRFWSKAFSYEREIFGFEKPLVQKVKYLPSHKYFEFQIVNPKTKEIHASVYCKKQPKDSFKIPTAWIESVHVDKEFAGKGLATQMLSEAVDVLHKSGVRNIYASVITPHKAVYELLGFEAVEQGKVTTKYLKHFDK